jgi:hypothetical protein
MPIATQAAVPSHIAATENTTELESGQNDSVALIRVSAWLIKPITDPPLV